MSEKLRRTLFALPSRFAGQYVFPSHLPSRKAEATGQRPFTDLKTGFKKALREAAISDFRFHDLRHTFASNLVMNGADLNTVRELLGHKSIKMTLRYAHLSPSHKERAIRLIDEALDSKQDSSDPARSSARDVTDTGSLGDTASDTIEN